MFSTIPFFTVPSAPTTTRIISVFICHILCISSARSLYLLFFSIAFSAMFLSDRIVISISLQVELTESLTMMSGLFAMIVMLLSLLCVTVSGLCSYHLLPELHARACAEPHSQENLSILENLVITWPYNERPTRVTKKFLEVSRCSRAKCTKKVCCTFKVAFLLIRPGVVFHRSPSLALHDFIFCFLLALAKSIYYYYHYYY